MSKQYYVVLGILILTITFVLILVLGGCDGLSPIPDSPSIAATPVVTIRKNPDITDIPAGGQVALSVEATGSNLQFKWRVEIGNLSRTDGQSVIYTAPNKPGLDTVDVIVTSNTGATTKTVTFTVIETSTEPVQTSTKELTKEPTAPSVTDTSTPTPQSGTPSPTQPKISLLRPKPEDCAFDDDCTITVEGTWIRTDARGTLKLYVLVRPIPDDPNQSYWVQALPNVNDEGQWISSDVFIGQPGDRPGLPFQVCAVATDQELFRGQSLEEPPFGSMICVDITRGSD